MIDKIILIIFNLIVIVLLVACTVWGFTFSNNMTVLSYKQLKDKKAEYDVALANYNQLVDEQYNTELKSLEQEKQRFSQSQQKFEQLKNINSYDELVKLSQSKQYNLEFLWIKLDLLARNNSLNANFKLNKSIETTNYDIAVTLKGDYLSIKNYIYDIMIDMDLHFKAENISIKLADGSVVQATFTIKNVEILM